MRIMLLYDSDEKIIITVECVHVGYDDDLFVTDQCQVSGLYMVCSDGDSMCIPGLDIITCNRICRDLLRTGYIDLTSYGEVEYFN